MAMTELSLQSFFPPSPSSRYLQRVATPLPRPWPGYSAWVRFRVGPGSSVSPHRSHLPPPRCSHGRRDGEKEGIRRSSKEGAADTVSWFEKKEGKDSFLGWDSSSSSSNGLSSLQPSSSSSSSSSSDAQALHLHHGWIKIGAGIILALGFSLGAYSVYKGKEGSKDFSFPLIGTEQTIDVKEIPEHVMAQENSDASNDVIEALERNESVLENGKGDPQSGDVAIEIQRQEHKMPVGLPETLGKVVVPASSDHMQEQILAALQALKVIEAGAKGSSICTRRDYARWLVTGSAVLTRSPSHKVFPAMYIEGVSKLAYNDVLPQDPDFPCIQGLAEAGLIPSNLDDGNDCFFLPDSPLTREDLVTWKVALEMKPDVTAEVASPSGKKLLQEASGFIDIDKIRQEAWPALLTDVKAGEHGIIALAFGFTRRFQPQKHVTKAQAAVAVASGESWELVTEELSRLEAESIAEAAVVAELTMEMKAQQEVADAFNELLQVGREKHEEAKGTIEALKVELERVKAEKEEEKLAFVRERAALNSERDFLLSMKGEMEEKSLALISAKLEVAAEREELDRLHAEAEKERDKIINIRAELEVERNALTLAREWADEEAKKALAHTRLLEKVRRRWEDHGIEVRVHKDLNEMNIPGPSWQYSKEYQSRASSWNSLVEMLKDLTQLLVNVVSRFLKYVQNYLQSIKQGSTEISRRIGDTFHEGAVKCEEAKRAAVDSIKLTVEEMTSKVKEGSLKAVEQWKGGAEKLSQKLKLS